MQTSKLRIGTRGSKLARIQAQEAKDRLVAVHGLDPDAIEIRVISTSGDRIQDRPLYELGGKGLFTEEIEEALIAGEIDLAVHSMKDMPAILPGGLAIASLLPREDARDAFISPIAQSLRSLPRGRSSAPPRCGARRRCGGSGPTSRLSISGATSKRGSGSSTRGRRAPRCWPARI